MASDPSARVPARRARVAVLVAMTVCGVGLVAAPLAGASSAGRLFAAVGIGSSKPAATPVAAPPSTEPPSAEPPTTERPTTTAAPPATAPATTAVKTPTAATKATPTSKPTVAPTPTTTPPATAPPAPATTPAAAADPNDPATHYAFLAMDGTRPVRYDPCTPVHYVVNTAEAPANGLDDLTEAVARLSAATGITFVFDGLTGEVPAAHRGMAKNDRYPNGWPPVLVGWAQPAESDLLTGGAIGEGGSTWYGAAGSEAYVTGVVVIDGSQTAKLNPGFGGNSLGAVLMHELGHVIGLDHVDDTSQIMFATVTDKPAVFAPGDLSGLRQLGRASGCQRAPRAPWAR